MLDIRVTDRAIAAAALRDERQQIDVGVPIADDHLGKLAASHRDVNQPCIALIGVDRRERAALKIRINQ